MKNKPDKNNQAKQCRRNRIKVEEILDYLNAVEIRATYGAVADALDVPVHPRFVGRHLGERRKRASWVVNKETGDPTDYACNEKHENFYRTEYIITSIRKEKNNGHPHFRLTMQKCKNNRDFLV